MIDAEWQVHAGPAALAQGVADAIAGAARTALAERGSALLALAGGSTPRSAYRRLAEARLDWPRVTLLPSDERLVEDGAALSNLGMLRETLGGTGVAFLPLVQAIANDYRAVGEAADLRLQALAWPLDLVLLGMGTDGHTASLFPGPDLEPALATNALAIGVMPRPLPPEAPVARVSLTGGAIGSARAILLIIAGEEKKRVIDEALRAGPASPFPIGRVLAAATGPIVIHWSPS